MADILIKGMDKPKYCYESDGQVVKPCDFLEVCRRKWGGNINALDVHSEACPLVELPSHDDLLARGNVLFNLQVEALSIDPKDKDIDGIKKGLLLARKAIMDAKPIIESDVFVGGMPKERIQITENLNMAEQIVKGRNRYGTDN